MSLTSKKFGFTVNPDMPDCRLHYSISNMQGKGSREEQEDSFTTVNALDEKAYLTAGLMFAVCDGMGGMKNGKLASNAAITSLRESFTEMNMQGEIPSQLKKAIYNASKAVKKELYGDGGSTAVICIVIHEKLFYASVGDSYLYLYRNGSLCRINSEHTICNELYLDNIRKKSTEFESCRNDPDAPVLTHYLGVPDLPEIDCNTRPLNLYRGDIILSCSDGIGGTVNENELAEALSWVDTCDVCRRIEEYVRGHAVQNQDNYTAVTLRCL